MNRFEKSVSINSINSDSEIIFDARDLIYNRFDIIYENDYEKICINYYDHEYVINCHLEKRIAKLDIWGKDIPEKVMEEAITQIEKRHPDVLWIDIIRGQVCYRNELVKGKETILLLPDDKDKLLLRLSSKERSHIRQYRKHLCGGEEIKVECFEHEIPYILINQYFEWKKITHGIDYCLEPDDYIKEYHVTNAMALYNSFNKLVSVLFFCKVNKTVYLENFSYDIQWKKYSPGYTLYIYFLMEMISEGCNIVFLGGGDYEYKKKFWSKTRDCYSGSIFMYAGYKMLDGWFSNHNISELGLYGMGNMGHAVKSILRKVNVILKFGIDKKHNDDKDIRVFNLEDELPLCDLVIITIKKKDKEIERFLKDKKMNYIYWDEIIDSIQKCINEC